MSSTYRSKLSTKLTPALKIDKIDSRRRLMRTKEVADICGVTEECIRQNAKKIGIVLENGKAHEYTEEELKKFRDN